MKERSKVIREVKVLFTPVHLLLFQYGSFSSMKKLACLSYSSWSIILMAMVFLWTKEYRQQQWEGRSEVRGHALVHQHTIKHTRQGRQMQHLAGVTVEEMTSPHLACREEESNSLTLKSQWKKSVSPHHHQHFSHWHLVASSPADFGFNLDGF